MNGSAVFKRRKPDEPQVPEPPPLPTAQPAQGGAADSGLGVPPYRPAPPKEPQNMSRAPFSGAPSSPPATAQRPAGTPPARQTAERRTLVVGKGISVQGVISDAERLIVEGTVESEVLRAVELVVAPGGLFRGTVEVEDSEIGGTIDGTLTARGSLVISSSGKVIGTARCRRLKVEDGGQITGQIEMITEAPRSDAPRAPDQAD